MTEPSMRERLARIIAEGVAADLPSDYIAGSVLAELREPTEAMVRAGAVACGLPDDHFDESAWQAMIAEARKS